MIMEEKKKSPRMDTHRSRKSIDTFDTNDNSRKYQDQFIDISVIVGKIYQCVHTVNMFYFTSNSHYNLLKFFFSLSTNFIVQMESSEDRQKENGLNS